MKVIIKKVNDKPKVINIGEGLRALQKAVGGSVEITPMFSNRKISRKLAVLYDEEGKEKKKHLNFFVASKAIMGDALFVNGGDDELADLTNKQITSVFEFFGCDSPCIT